jgi:hypothetical protein
VIAEAAKDLVNLPPEQKGKVVGWILYQVAETVVTAGVAKALTAAGKAAKVGKLTSELEKLGLSEKTSARIVKCLEEFGFCFTEETPVLVPEFGASVESLEDGSDDSNGLDWELVLALLGAILASYEYRIKRRRSHNEQSDENQLLLSSDEFDEDLIRP